MDELRRDEVEALEHQLQAAGDERALEGVLEQGEAAALRLDALAARADRLASRVRARVISRCRERLGGEP